jgi:protein involved in polysaccharide export with SLBB domain
MRLLALLPGLLLASAMTADAAAAQSAAPSSAPNHLEPGDRILLRIWREENMSGEFRVDADGTVVFPRLGVWPVGGKDADRLKDELVAAYARYLRTPSIEVIFLRRINVGGAVLRPGVYHIDTTMTVRDVLLEAGGPTPIGRTDRLELIRAGDVIQARLRQDVPILESPIRSGDQLWVPERSWLSRNTNAAVGIGSALLSFAATMIILAASN